MINNVAGANTGWWTFMMMNPNFKKINKYRNDRSFMNIYSRLVNLSLNSFEWINLPESVNEKYLEGAYLFNGGVALGMDKELGYVGLPFSNTDKLNIYGESPNILLYGNNGYNKKYVSYIRGADNTLANAVKGYDNPMGYPYIMYIIEASENISNVLRSGQVAVNKLKNPYILIGNKEDIPNIREVMKKLANNEDAIITADTVNKEPDTILNVKDTSINTAIIDALWQQYQRYSNDIQEILGINSNDNIDKKERLLVDEVNSNNESTAISLDLRLKSRKEFCRDVNDLFGLNIDVRPRQTTSMPDDMHLDEDDNYKEDIEDRGGEDNEDI